MTGHRHKKDCKCKLCFKVAWNKGLTKENNNSILKMANKKMGMVVSKIHRYKIGISNKGKKRDKRTIELIRKNTINQFKNGMPELTKQKIREKNIGKKRSEQTKENNKKARKQQILPRYDTKIEIKIQEYLKLLCINFYTHQYMNIKHGYQCDIFIPSLNLVIECDGDYWHKYPVGTNIDHIRTKELIEKGFKILRLWENEIKVMDINNFQKRLKC